MKREHLILAGAVVGLVIVGFVLWWLWLFIEGLGVGALRAWAILATLALPVVGFAGWTLGRYEATALLKGVDKGVDKVAVAATKLRTKEVKQSPVNVAVLPPLPPVQHRQLTGGESEVVDL